MAAISGCVVSWKFSFHTVMRMVLLQSSGVGGFRIDSIRPQQ
jgi:hypothetical protein